MPDASESKVVVGGPRIRLNVSGSCIDVPLRLLQAASQQEWAAKVLEEDASSSEGIFDGIFLDADPTAFRFILMYLKTGALPNSLSQEEAFFLRQEAERFGLSLAGPLMDSTKKTWPEEMACKNPGTSQMPEAESIVPRKPPELESSAQSYSLVPLLRCVRLLDFIVPYTLQWDFRKRIMGCANPEKLKDDLIAGTRSELPVAALILVIMVNILIHEAKGDVQTWDQLITLVLSIFGFLGSSATWYHNFATMRSLPAVSPPSLIAWLAANQRMFQQKDLGLTVSAWCLQGYAVMMMPVRLLFVKDFAFSLPVRITCLVCILLCCSIHVITTFFEWKVCGLTTVFSDCMSQERVVADGFDMTKEESWKAVACSITRRSVAAFHGSQDSQKPPRASLRDGRRIVPDNPEFLGMT